MRLLFGEDEEIKRLFLKDVREDVSTHTSFRITLSISVFIKSNPKVYRAPEVTGKARRFLCEARNRATSQTFTVSSDPL